MVVLDTSAVPDVVDLRAQIDNAEPARVLPGRAQNSVQVLIPDNRAAPWGFHDVTIVDMATEARPPVSKEELSTLRQQWLVSLVSGMLKRQCGTIARPDFAGLPLVLYLLWTEHCA